MAEQEQSLREWIAEDIYAEWGYPESYAGYAFKDVYAEIAKDLNDAVILHNEIKPNGNVMIKGGFIAELQKKYVTKLRALVIPEVKE